jgi:hypothetical protein
LREPDKCAIEYCGYTDPKSTEELEFEILGLKTAMCEIEKRIATLKQSNYLVTCYLQKTKK